VRRLSYCKDLAVETLMMDVRGWMRRAESRGSTCTRDPRSFIILMHIQLFDERERRSEKNRLKCR